MFTDNTIGKRVQAVIKQRIATAQERFNTVCNQIEEDHEAKVAQLVTEKETKKETLADELVADILGK